jgi:hypothetical protein
VSGFDEQIDEDSPWAEMSDLAREAERARGYQMASLAALITASARAGRYDEMVYYEDLLDRAKTAREAERLRSPELEAALAGLFSLPLHYSTDETRRRAVEAYAWRVRHREASADPLVPYARHRDEETRWAAAEGLAFARRSEGLDVLLQLAKEPYGHYEWRPRPGALR